MKGRKNDFSISFFSRDGKRVMFLEYVHDTRKACRWAEDKGVKFSYFKLYERRTRKFLGSYDLTDFDATDPL